MNAKAAELRPVVSRCRGPSRAHTTAALARPHHRGPRAPTPVASSSPRGAIAPEPPCRCCGAGGRRTSMRSTLAAPRPSRSTCRCSAD
eukprot:217625-Prymnesium_polylepis.1